MAAYVDAGVAMGGLQSAALNRRFDSIGARLVLLEKIIGSVEAKREVDRKALETKIGAVEAHCGRELESVSDALKALQTSVNELTGGLQDAEKSGVIRKRKGAVPGWRPIKGRA